MQQAGNREIGLYIHIPFCRAKCRYCDFNSYARKEEFIPSYFSALKKDIALSAGLLKDRTIKTVFIGGGTPSLAEPHFITDLLETCGRSLNIRKDAEISIETNPGTLSRKKLASYRAAGINRLSIGLQAWQDNLLESLGRIHNVREFEENYLEARKAGFDNINIDLIFGIPGQTFSDWKATVKNVAALEPEHISCYSLKIEEGTVFGSQYESGELIPVEDELDREMYQHAIEALTKHGFRHYEISNFARPGFECRHNLIYWKAEEYLGTGAGAHSYLNGERYGRACRIDDYTASIEKGIIPAENIERIDGSEQISEFMILGLRLTDGISSTEFKARFRKDVFGMFHEQFSRLVKRKLLEVDGDRIRLTRAGLDLANEVFVEFV